MGFASFIERKEWAKGDRKRYACRRCNESKRAVEFANISIASPNPYRFDCVCRACKSKMEMDRRVRKTSSLEGAVSYRLISLRNKSKRLKLEFDLDPVFVIGLWNRQCGECFYSGRKMEYAASGSGYAGKNQFSIDRVDPQKGYVRDNVVLCLNHVNTMKSDLTEAEFYQIVHDISQRSGNASLN
jgi:hypothetical protein